MKPGEMGSNEKSRGRKCHSYKKMDRRLMVREIRGHFKWMRRRVREVMEGRSLLVSCIL